MKRAIVGAVGAIMVACTAIAVMHCLPTASSPRADATDSAWYDAQTSPGFDAGSGSGGF